MYMVEEAKGGVTNKEAVQRRHLLAADPEIDQRHHMRPGLQESDLHSTTLQVPQWAQNTANTDCEHSTHHCTSCEGAAHSDAGGALVQDGELGPVVE